MPFAIIQESRIGARRENQDRLGHWSTGEALLMVLADGMGGHPRGEVAAEIAVGHFANAFREEARPRLADPASFVARAFAGSHVAIARRAAELRLPDSPRTTAVACVVQDGIACWSHLGDSRLYLVRAGEIVARTRDHTPVQRLVDAGRLREEAVPLHPDRNKLLQCLGGDPPPEFEPVTSAALAKNDIVLLCSNGLWGPLRPRELLGTLLGAPLRAAVRELVALAETVSGPECDNVSVLALSWDGGGQAAQLPMSAQDFTTTEPGIARGGDGEEGWAITRIRAALQKVSGKS